MIKYIALLRGINVGGHKKFPKAEQLDMLNELGFSSPQVYIHTGNWVFESNEKAASVSLKISEAILKKYGWQVPVIVITATDFKKVFDSCPFQEEKKENSYFTLLQETPTEEVKQRFNEFSFPDEEFQLGDCSVYFYSTKSAARVKMSNNFIEKKLNVAATSRNYKTMVRLIELSK